MNGEPLTKVEKVELKTAKIGAKIAIGSMKSALKVYGFPIGFIASHAIDFVVKKLLHRVTNTSASGYVYKAEL